MKSNKFITEEMRRRIIEGRGDNWHPTAAHRKAISIGNTGRKFPIELFPNKGMRGKHQTKHARKLIGDSKRGKPFPAAWRNNMSLVRLGKKFRPEWREHQRIAQRKRYWKKHKNNPKWLESHGYPPKCI